MATLTDVPGVSVGHYTNLEAATGCTVVLTPEGARAGVAVRGGGPGTRELALLQPGRLIDAVHGVLLTGGSAFGLAAAEGVMDWLETHGYGYETGVARVPIVPAAVLYDLDIGRYDLRPNAEAGFAACEAASTDPVPMGNVGAGTGATVGKILGPAHAMKGGLGSASVNMGDGVIVGAVVAVNTLGDVVDPATGRIIAGARRMEGDGFMDTTKMLIHGPAATPHVDALHTTLGVVATNADLSKAVLSQVANMTHAGLARTLYPVHTLYDGDTIFALSTGTLHADVNCIGVAAAAVMAEAILRAIRTAAPVHGYPATDS